MSRRPPSEASNGSLDGTYERLRRVAAGLMASERGEHTLQPTALVHEAWLRLAAYRERNELSTRELEMLACHVMRRVLTDHARRRRRAKRDTARNEAGHELDRLEQDGAEVVLEVDRALGELAELDAELARVVELRFFGGLTLEEVAAATGLSLRTVVRRWQLARAWLIDALGEHEVDPSEGTR